MVKLPPWGIEGASNTKHQTPNKKIFPLTMFFYKNIYLALPPQSVLYIKNLSFR
jgi:hypothetical protein